MKMTADLISQIESTNNPYAIRYEPAHKPSMTFVDRIQKIVGCSEDTARMFCMCSFGLYQIMGDELMSLGLTISPLDYVYLRDPAIQHVFFHKFLGANKIDFPIQMLKDETCRMHFARIYNGPGNVQTYADKMLHWLNQWGI